jgi:diguanylate cyclase (GGDEF)-like protein
MQVYAGSVGHDDLLRKHGYPVLQPNSTKIRDRSKAEGIFRITEGISRRWVLTECSLAHRRIPDGQLTQTMTKNNTGRPSVRTGSYAGIHEMLDYTLARVAALPVRTQVGLAVVLQAMVIVADALTGRNISVSFFYLPGLVLMAWAVNARYAAAYALVSAVAERGMLNWGAAGGGVLAWNSLVRLLTFLAVIGLVSALKRRLDHEAELARTDPLTGLMNRRAFLERAQLEQARFARLGTSFAIAYVDCDNFKQVNDTLGHQRGDELLRIIAGKMLESIRDCDAAARIGGDEFAVLFEGVDYSGAGTAANKLHVALTSAVAEMNVPVGFSIGVAVAMHPEGSVEELIHAADTLMFEVKTEGKGRVKLKQVNGDVHGEGAA